MTDAEFAGRITALHEQFLSLRDNKDFVLNPPQADKLAKLILFFMDEAAAQQGSVEPVHLEAREEYGGVTAVFPVFSLKGEAVSRFGEALKACSALSIDASDDGVCISCTIPNIFVLKEQA